MKKLSQFVNDREGQISISDIIKNSIVIENEWTTIMNMDFEDLPVYHKGKDGLMIDVILDNCHNYQYSKHKPCIYFRVGQGEYDFLPMIIEDTPYVPYSFEQKITDRELLWVCNWVRSNKSHLIKYANEEIDYKSFASSITENLVSMPSIDEGKAKIPTNVTGLTRTIWIGPYENTGHYLRIKVQSPKSSNISTEWASLSIPDLKLTPSHTDITRKEKKAIDSFSLLNQKCLNDFANDTIDFQTLQSQIIKVDKKENPKKD